MKKKQSSSSAGAYDKTKGSSARTFVRDRAPFFTLAFYARIPVDCKNSTSIITGATYRIITR